MGEGRPPQTGARRLIENLKRCTSVKRAGRNSRPFPFSSVRRYKGATDSTRVLSNVYVGHDRRRAERQDFAARWRAEQHADHKDHPAGHCHHAEPTELSGVSGSSSRS